MLRKMITHDDYEGVHAPVHNERLRTHKMPSDTTNTLVHTKCPRHNKRPFTFCLVIFEHLTWFKENSSNGI